jgi:hypothetical protein
MNYTRSGTAARWGLRIHILCYIAANVTQVLVWWRFTPERHFWPVWSIVGWGVGLAFHIRAVTATILAAVLAQRGLDHADVVVSGLPWAVFAADQQRDVLSAIVAALPPHGVFTTFAYVHAQWAPPARRLLRTLRARFDEVAVGRTVWANLPPALVYACRRPYPSGDSW